MPATHLLYLHGFRSSPQSTKARMVEERMRRLHPDVTWWCPQLPPSPRLAMQQVMDGVAAWPRATMAVAGSSLGGFYAVHVAEQTGCRLVVLNPAVHAARDLARHVGEHVSWHDPNERFVFLAQYVDELRALEHGPLTHPERCFAVIAKGDEVLDWREMTARFSGARVRLIEGSDHALGDFDSYIAEVFEFLELPGPA
jgi:uncharacterized protein